MYMHPHEPRPQFCMQSPSARELIFRLIHFVQTTENIPLQCTANFYQFDPEHEASFEVTVAAAIGISDLLASAFSSTLECSIVMDRDYCQALDIDQLFVASHL